MKINQKELKEMYLTLTNDQTEDERGCPLAEDLIRTFTDEFNSRDKSKIVDHITKCSRCLEKFQIIREFFKIGKQLAKDMEGQSLSSEELNQLKEIKKDKSSIPTKNPLKLKFLAVAATLLVIIGTVLILQTGKDPGDTQLRGTVEGEISFVSPRGEIDKTFIIFKWESLKGATGYRVHLFDDELTQVWKSPVTKQPSIKLPDDIYQNLAKRKIYYWKLELFQEDIMIRETGFQKFRIK
jgi:hypothetical protein